MCITFVAHRKKAGDNKDMPSFVYVAHLLEMPGVYKIGMTKDLVERSKALRQKYGEIQMYSATPFDRWKAVAVERSLHCLLSDKRFRYGVEKELYRLSVGQAEAIEEILK